MHVPAPRTDVCVCSTAQQPETRPFYEAYQQPMVDDNAEFEHLLHDEAMDDAEDAEDGGIDGDDELEQLFRQNRLNPIGWTG